MNEITANLNNVSEGISVENQHRLIFAAALLEPTYYLETVPNLIYMFTGIKMTWMTGANTPYNGNEHTWTFESRVQSAEDAAKLKDYFHTGKVTSLETPYFVEYHWREDIDIKHNQTAYNRNR